MDLKQLKKLHTSILKYAVNDFNIKQSLKVLGHTLDVEYTVDFNLGSYTFLEPLVEDVSIPKGSQKFFKELEEATGVEIGEMPSIRDSEYELNKKIEKEFQWYLNLKPSTHIKTYLNALFFDGSDTLNPWDVVKERFSPDWANKTNFVDFKLNAGYTARLMKGQPVQVGCQTFPIEIIRNLVAAYDKLNENKA